MIEFKEVIILETKGNHYLIKATRSGHVFVNNEDNNEILETIASMTNHICSEKEIKTPAFKLKGQKKLLINRFKNNDLKLIDYIMQSYAEDLDETWSYFDVESN